MKVVLLTGENQHDIERMVLEQYQVEDLFDMVLVKPISCDRIEKLLRDFNLM
jgi:hypothetical protein